MLPAARGGAGRSGAERGGAGRVIAGAIVSHLCKCFIRSRQALVKKGPAEPAAR